MATSESIPARGMRTLREYAVYPMLLGSTVTLLVLVRLGFYAFIGPVAGATVGSLLAVVTKCDNFEPVHDPIDSRYAVIGTALSIVAMIVVFRSPLYTRPASHYLLFAGSAAFIAYQIFVGQPRHHVLPQILLVAFFTYWSTQFLYPTGVKSPDGGLVGTAGDIAAMGYVPEGAPYEETPTHMLYVAMGILSAGLGTVTTYQFMSIVALLTTVAMIGIFDKVIPGICRRTALFGALIFATMSFTLRRGMFPDKTNFFKPILALFVIVAFYKFYWQYAYHRYTLLSIICLPMLVFGHVYSSGAALMLVGALWGFRQLTELLGGLDYEQFVSSRSLTVFVTIIFIAIVGYSLAGGSGLIGRVASIIQSMLDLVVPDPTSTTGAASAAASAAGSSAAGSSAAGSSGGQYSSLSLRVLLVSTVAQAILFTLCVVGIAVVFKRQRWSVDAIIVWTGVGLGTLAFSVFGDAINIPTPRIYLLLGMFGVNLLAALGLFALATKFPVKPRYVAIVVTFLLVGFYLASPVASAALSPVADEIPGKWRNTPPPDEAQMDWADTYGGDDMYLTRNRRTELPVRRTSATTGQVRTTPLNETIYEYRRLARTRGVRVTSARGKLGAGIRLFLELPPGIDRESKVYTAGTSTVYRHHNRSDTNRTTRSR